MDSRVRRLERAYAQGDERAGIELRAYRRRARLFSAGDHVRIDASRATIDPECHGSFVIVTARNEAEGRTYGLVRILPDGSYSSLAGTFAISEEDLQAASVPLDTPLTFAGPAMWLRCGRCAAVPGNVCVTPSGGVARNLHRGRYDQPIPPTPPTPTPLPVIAAPRRTKLDGAVRARLIENRETDPDLRITLAQLRGEPQDELSDEDRLTRSYAIDKTETSIHPETDQ